MNRVVSLVAVLALLAIPAAHAADLGTITFTRSIGLGVSGTAGQNTLIRNVNQTGTQCLPPGGPCSFGGDSFFTNTSDPFEAKVNCSGTAVNNPCKARFDPGLPPAFMAVDNQLGKTGVPCGTGDPNFNPDTGFPYDCNSVGTIHQIVPKGILDKPNPKVALCVTTNTSTVGTSPSGCPSPEAPQGDQQLANFRMAPPSSLLVGAPFQVYSSYKSGNRRIHHIEDGFSAQDSGPDTGSEAQVDDTGAPIAAGGGSTIMRFLFVIDVQTDAGGHITDDGTGNVRANGTFTLEMDDRHNRFNCQVPIDNIPGGTNDAQQRTAGLGSFRAGETGLLIDAATNRLDCFDNAGNPCPTGRVLDVVPSEGRIGRSFCPGDRFPGP